MYVHTFVSYVMHKHTFVYARTRTHVNGCMETIDCTKLKTSCWQFIYLFMFMQSMRRTCCYTFWSIMFLHICIQTMSSQPPDCRLCLFYISIVTLCKSINDGIHSSLTASNANTAQTEYEASAEFRRCEA